jgi:subtilisin-like proprotein convertase family protein
VLRQRLEEYVAAGGRLIIEGGDLCRNHDDEHPSFAGTVLSIADWRADPGGNLSCFDDAHPVSTFPNLLPGEIGFQFAAGGSSDACIPAPGAHGVYDWIGQNGRFGVITRDDDGDPETGGQQVTLALSVERILSETERRDLVENVAQWVVCTGGPHVLHHAHTIDDGLAGNGDGVVDPGETVELAVTLRNTGMGWARNTVARLTTGQPEYVTFSDNYATYPDIPDGGARSTSRAPHYTLLLDPGTPCGTEIAFTLEIAGDGFRYSRGFILKVGTGGGGESSFASTDTPMPIPNPGVGQSIISVPDAFGVGDVTTAVSAHHSGIERIKLWLISPEGTQVVLHDHSGSGMELEATYDTTRQPDGPGAMWWYDTEVATGDWSLFVEDDQQDMLTGVLDSWSLWFLRGNLCTDYQCPYPLPDPVGDTLMVESLGGGNIRLEWEAASGAESYNVWRSADVGFEEAETVGNSGPGNTWYEEIGARHEAGLYFYLVRGANPCRREGE